jgi:hypothetical protein
VGEGEKLGAGSRFALASRGGGGVTNPHENTKRNALLGPLSTKWRGTG